MSGYLIVAPLDRRPPFHRRWSLRSQYRPIPASAWVHLGYITAGDI